MPKTSPSLIEILASGLKDALDYIDLLESKLQGSFEPKQKIDALKQQLAEDGKTITLLQQQLDAATAQINDLTNQLFATNAALNADDEQLQQLTGLTDLITKLQAKAGNATNYITPDTPVISLPSGTAPIAASAPIATLNDPSVTDVSGASGDTATALGTIADTHSADVPSPATDALPVAAASIDPVLSAPADAPGDHDSASSDGAIAAPTSGDAVAPPSPTGAV